MGELYENVERKRSTTRRSRNAQRPPDLGHVLFRVTILVASLVILVTFLTAKREVGSPPYLNDGLLIAVSVAVYLAVSWFFRPQPDLSNVGWLGGLIDNPLRISDDINRFLMLMVVVLAPGRFVVKTLIDVTRLVLHHARGKDQKKKQFEP